MILALVTHIPMAAINSLLPVGFWDDEHSGHPGFTLEFTIQVKLTIYQDQELLPTCLLMNPIPSGVDALSPI